MTRPKDWGDQFPADSDDVMPEPITTGMNEFDYDPRESEPLQVKIAELRRWTPTKEEYRQEPTRIVYTALIVEKQSREETVPVAYTVIRNDGVAGTAYDWSDSSYRSPGDKVSIVHGELPKEWLITGNNPDQECGMLELSPTSTTIVFETIVPFATEVKKYPVDSEFGSSDVLQMYDNGIEVVRGGVFDIALTLVVESYNTNEATSGLAVVVECLPETGLSQDVTGTVPDAKKIVFDRGSGFRLDHSYEDCTVYVRIEPERCNQSLSGWLKFGNTWLGGSLGSGTLRLRLPSSGPGSSCDFLTVQQLGETGYDCVQLGWQAPGATGTVNFAVPTGETSFGYFALTRQCSLFVERGLIVGDSCGILEAPECDRRGAVCLDKTCTDLEPC